MKRIGNLWEEITRMENLADAFRLASRGKHWQNKVCHVEEHLDEYLNKLKVMLDSGEYHTSRYRTKTIWEPKKRVIYILPFYPDRIAHHAVMNILEPYWDSAFFFDSYACRKEKGQHVASRRCTDWTRKFKYVLKCDVSKFYPSVDHAVLKMLIRRKLKDKKLLAFLDEVIDSANKCPGSVLGKNVPIGNYLSQWFGNLYLNELDAYVKQELHVRPYERYCDDFLLFSDDKSKLHEWSENVENFLGSRLKLVLSKCDIFPVSQGIDFLGYRHFPDHILVRKSTAKKMKRRISLIRRKIELGSVNWKTAQGQVASTMGWMGHANSKHFSDSLGLPELKAKIDANLSKI